MLGLPSLLLPLIQLHGLACKSIRRTSYISSRSNAAKSDGGRLAWRRKATDVSNAVVMPDGFKLACFSVCLVN